MKEGWTTMGRKFVQVLLVFLMCCAGFSQNAQQNQSQQPQQGDANSQQQNPPADQQQQQQPQDQKKSKFGGLFKKPVTASNSSQNKDTASLGPNGLDPDGMPTKSQMDESANAADEAKAQALNAQITNKAEVDQFIQQGNLKNGKS